MLARMSDTLTVGTGSYTYQWNSRWAQVPREVSFRQTDGTLNGRCHGVCVANDGRVFVFNQSEIGVLIFNPDGSWAGTWKEFPSKRFEGAHGLTLHNEGSEQFLWLTDQTSKEVVKTTLDGETVMNIQRPFGGVYEDKDAAYTPTWAAQAQDGSIYVADGYGSGHISRYTRGGEYLDSFSGDVTDSAAGTFRCPHAIWIGQRPGATRRSDEVIYVTDRGNNKVQVYDLEWNFIKSFGQVHPCCFDVAPNGDLLVPDLLAFVQVYDEHDQPIAALGMDIGRAAAPGWPNYAPATVPDGKFNSPHGGCFDAEGNIYIAEWIIGGRITKLTRV